MLCLSLVCCYNPGFCKKSLEAFFFLFFKVICIVLVLVHGRSGRILHEIHLALGFLLFRGFLITAPISLVVIDLFKLFTSSWFSSSRLHASRNSSMSFRFSSSVEYQFESLSPWLSDLGDILLLLLFYCLLWICSCWVYPLCSFSKHMHYKVYPLPLDFPVFLGGAIDF